MARGQDGFDGAGSELLGRLHEEGVRPAEVVRRTVALQREREVAGADAHRGVQPVEQGGVGPRRQETGERRRDLGLAIAVGRENTAHCQDTRH